MTTAEPNRPFTLYFSHRVGRGSLPAQDLSAAIEGVARGKVVAHCSAHFTPDERWAAHAGRALEESDWLVLLLGERTLEWDWWLWELGYFASIKGNRDRRVICLCQPGIEVPMPLRAWHSRPASAQESRRMLVSIFQEPPLAIRPDLFAPAKEPILNMLVGMIVRCCAVPGVAAELPLE